MIRRKARYSAKGGNAKGAEKRWDGTTWKQSPARMYSLARSTAAMNPASVKLLPGCGIGGRRERPHRQAHQESAAATLPGLAADAAAMGLRDLLDQREPESHAARLLRMAPDPIERLEDLFARVVRNAGSAVEHLQQDLGGIRRSGYAAST